MERQRSAAVSLLGGNSGSGCLSRDLGFLGYASIEKMGAPVHCLVGGPDQRSRGSGTTWMSWMRSTRVCGGPEESKILRFYAGAGVFDGCNARLTGGPGWVQPYKSSSWPIHARVQALRTRLFKSLTCSGSASDHPECSICPRLFSAFGGCNLRLLEV